MGKIIADSAKTGMSYPPGGGTQLLLSQQFASPLDLYLGLTKFTQGGYDKVQMSCD